MAFPSPTPTPTPAPGMSLDELDAIPEISFDELDAIPEESPSPSTGMPWYEQMGRAVGDVALDTAGTAGKFGQALFNPAQFAADQMRKGPSLATQGIKQLKGYVGDAPDTTLANATKWGASAALPIGGWQQRVLSALGGFVGEEVGGTGGGLVGSVLGGTKMVGSKLEPLLEGLPKLLKGGWMPQVADDTTRAISMAERVSGVTGSNADKLRVAETLTDPRIANAKIAGEFGVGVGRTNFDVSISGLAEDVPRLTEMGIIGNATSKTVGDIQTNVGLKLDEVGGKIATAKKQLESVYRNGSIKEKGKDLPGTIKWEDLREPVEALQTRAETLMKSDLTADVGKELMQQIKQLRNKDFLTGRSPAEAVEILQNWNYARRMLGQFDSAALAAGSKQEAGQVAAMSETTAAADRLTKTLTEQIRLKIKDMNRGYRIKTDPEVFIKLNEDYSALKNLDRTITGKTNPQIDEAFGRSGSRRAIQAPGQDSKFAATDFTGKGAFVNALNSLAERVGVGVESNADEIIKSYRMAEDIPKNIGDLAYFKDKMIPPMPTKMDAFNAAMDTSGLKSLKDLDWIGGASRSALANPNDPSGRTEEPTPQLPIMDPRADFQQRAMEYMQNGLPRDSQSFMQDNVALGAFVDKIKGTPKEGIGIQLGKKLADAVKAKDTQKTQRIIADMAKLFPEVFEEGLGVDNKLFHPDDQRDYVNMLWSAQRKGVVKANFIAKQRDAFLDPNDSQIIPFEPSEKHMVDLGEYAKPDQARPVSMGPTARRYNY